MSEIDIQGKLLAYAANCKDEKLRLRCSSGAIFPLLAEYIVSSLSGVVYGVVMSSTCRTAEFMRISSLNNLELLYGSKYLAAKIGNTFSNVKKDLENGICVLFSGVGCQINGLKTFLGKSYDNLYCVEVICHGVPSPLLWNKYINSIESKAGIKIKSVSFRYKQVRRIHNNYFEKSTANEIYISRNDNFFMQMYLKNYCLRPSCYECYAKQTKCADITLGDFWGVEDVVTGFNSDKGVSLVIIRNNKGKELFGNIKNFISYKPVSYDKAIIYNPAEFQSAVVPMVRADFIKDLYIMDYNSLEKKYINISFKRKIKQTLLKTPVRNLLRQYIIPKIDSSYGMLLTFKHEE